MFPRLVSAHPTDFGQKRYPPTTTEDRFPPSPECSYYPEYSVVGGEGVSGAPVMLGFSFLKPSAWWGGRKSQIFSREEQTAVSLALLRKIRARRWSILTRNHCQAERPKPTPDTQTGLAVPISFEHVIP